jgi:hypothetical protein
MLAEGILAVHFEHEPAQVADAILAGSQEGAALPSELSRRRKSASRGARQGGRRRRGVRVVFGSAAAQKGHRRQRNSAFGGF